jgi:hypothetical protein
MTQKGIRFVGLLGLACGLIGGMSARPIRAADDDATVHRLLIYNGGARTVHYVSKGLSSAEKATLTELEEAENGLETALAQQSDDLLPPRTLRRWSNSDVSNTYSYPYGYGYGYYYPWAAWPGWGGYWSPLLYYPYAYTYGGPTSVTDRSQEGYEEIIHPISPAAVREQRAAVDRARKRLDAARGRVRRSERLRTLLKLPAPEDVTVHLKNNTKVEGKLISSDDDTVVVETDKEVVEIQKREVISIATAKKKGE